MSDHVASRFREMRSRYVGEPSLLGTVALVLLAIALLFAFDTFLAAKDEAANRAQAEARYREGQRLVLDGRDAEAVELFQAAVSMVRTEPAYQLALGQAELAAGRLPEAQATLATLLERDALSGSANLAMARVLAKQGRVPDAIAHYHRAIYGRWAEDTTGNQTRVRLELIEFMVARNQTRDLLAELLPIEDLARDDPAALSRLGRWFIIAGAPSRALTIFRELARHHPDDPGILAGVGEAAFALGDHRAARDAFSAALRARPGDPNLQARLALVEQVLALDPTQRGLDGAERYRRSSALVRLALDRLTRCAGATPAPGDSATISQARLALGAPMPRSRRFEASEGNLELAVQLWQATRRVCGEAVAGSPSDPASVVLAKIAQ